MTFREKLSRRPIVPYDEWKRRTRREFIVTMILQSLAVVSPYVVLLVYLIRRGIL